MTTLPQTTPMRLPRPSGAGQIAIPSAGVGGGLAQPAAGAQMTGSDVWRVFRTNWWLIAGMAVLMAVVGFFVNQYLARNHPAFTATGFVRVQTTEEVFRADGQDVSSTPQTVELELKTQASGLRQPALMLDTLTASDKIRKTEWFAEYNTPEAAKANLEKKLNVVPQQNTRLIAVEMTFRNPRDARTIVEEIVNQYIKSLQTKYRDDWSDRAQKLEKQLGDYDVDLRRIKAKLTDSSSAGEAIAQKTALVETKRWELGNANELLQTAQRELSQANQEVKSLDDLAASGESPPEIEAQIFQDRLIGDYTQRLDLIETRLQTLSGSNNPSYPSVQREKQQIEQKLNDRRELLRTGYVSEKRYVATNRKDAADTEVKSLSARIEQLKIDMQTLQVAAATYRTLEDEQRALTSKMDEVKDELDRLRLRKLPSGWAPVDWFTMPPTPTEPSFPKLAMTLSVAVAIGLALSIGIAFLREITDTSVRSPRDIARVGQMNMLGMIPHEQDDPQAAGARLPLVIFDAPHSMAAEEFRKLRTRLQHAASLDSTRSILVSSANPGDGKTMIATNLAAGLALNGRRILLVDANFRRPDIHNLFEVANERGFSDALNDLATFDTLVRDTPVQNLFVMPTGPKPVNATELLESQLLIDFVERALEEYDHVIFDSGPLLLASETMALAPRVDGVISVVRARANSRGVLARMRDMLRQVKAEHLGVVLNAVRSQGGGYYGRNIKNYYAYQNS